MEKIKEYTNGEVTVVWKPELCHHSRNCVHGLPEVFDPGERPWINLDPASSDEIIETVNKCPSGALTYYLNASGKPREEVQPAATSVQILTNGPLVVHADTRIELPNGAVIERKRRVSLCRCGASGNKPFCDGSHSDISFVG